MADILPFKGVVYNKEKVKEIEKVVTPPYDVISKDEQEQFYNLHPCNIIRITLGKDLSGDDEKNNKYTRAADCIRKWLADGTLIKENKDAIYIYEQKYAVKNGEEKVRKGFIALTSLQDFSSKKILPHEKTLSKPKEDRLQLMRACNGNSCQVFALYFDEKKRVDRILDETSSSDPLFDFTDRNGISHRFWSLKDSEKIGLIQKAMEEKELLIADGHHRYETALNYRNEKKEKSKNFTGKESFNYIAMMFINAESEGLTIFPTHRVVNNLNDFNADKILKKIGEYFTVKSFNSGESEKENLFKKLSEAGEKNPSFGMSIKGSDKFYLLTLDNKKLIDGLFPENTPAEWKELDVVILHTVVIENILGISKENQAGEKNIIYVKLENEALKKVKEGDAQIAFILNPTKVSQVKNVALKGMRMPQKSTFFYPKLLTGLVMNLFED